MIILIATVTIILYIILLGFTLHNLNPILDKRIKIGYIVGGLLVMLVVTFIVFGISSSGIQYDKPSMVGNVRLIMLAVFIPVNGIIVMPYLASVVSKMLTHDVTEEKMIKRIIIISIIFIVVLIFECSYFRTTQQGIINLINHM